jgi:serine/threonine-protein kinase
VAADLEKIEGTLRSTLLVDLYRDLFSEEPQGTGKLPAAPEPSTQASEVPTVSAEMASPPPRKPLRLWIIAGAATLVVAVVVAVTLPMLLEEPGKMPTPKLEPKAAPAPEPPPPPVEPEPAVGEGTEETEPAPPPPVRKPTGLLDINVEPWAKVYRGKKLLGVTPLEGVVLPVGKQRLRLVNEERKIKRTVTVFIKKNQTTRKTFKLEEE